jgi:UTP--glucose-1-phosphate uridylyltransferase
MSSNVIQKCLFPVAGYGTRFLPATKAMPKEMLPILTKPLIQYGVEEALAAGMTQMAFVTGRGKRAIADHFDMSYELEHQIRNTSKEPLLDEIRNLIEKCSFSYTRQIEMRGLGDAILKGETLIGNQPFGVILADDLCTNGGEPVMSQMARLYKEHNCCIVAIEDVPIENVSSYGIIEADKITDDLYQVTRMVEKPDPENAPSTMGIIGRYILTPEIFDILRDTPPGKNGELQVTDALNTLAEQGKVLAYRFKGRRFDCGSLPGFVAATNYFFEKGQGL